MADPKQAQEIEPGIEPEEDQVVELPEVDTEGGRTETAKPKAEQEPEAIEADAPKHRQDDEGDEETAEQRRHGRTARARKESQRRAKERDKARIAELEARLAKVEGATEQVRSSQQVQGLEVIQNRLNEAAGRMVAAQAKMAAALTEGNGVAHSQAMTELLQAHNEAQQLSSALDYAKRNGAGGNGHAQPQQPQQTEQRPSPALNRDGVRLRDDFLDEFEWLDTAGGDPDSRAVMRIDDAVAAEGFNRNSPDYWDEVRARMRENERLAQRLSGTAQPTNKRRDPAGPPLGGRREAMPGSSNGGVTLPAKMVALMKETGQWDDVAKRHKVAADFKVQMAGLTPAERASVMKGY